MTGRVSLFAGNCALVMLPTVVKHLIKVIKRVSIVVIQEGSTAPGRDAASVGLRHTGASGAIRISRVAVRSESQKHASQDRKSVV